MKEEELQRILGHLEKKYPIKTGGENKQVVTRLKTESDPGRPMVMSREKPAAVSNGRTSNVIVGKLPNGIRTYKGAQQHKPITASPVDKKVQGPVVTKIENPTRIPNTAVYPGNTRTTNSKPLPKPHYGVGIPNGVRNLGMATSKLANRIKDWLISTDLYEDVKLWIRPTKGTYYQDQFYKQLGNCVYHSLADYLSISRDDTGRFSKDASGNLIMPEITLVTPYLSTIWFITRIFSAERTSGEQESVKLLEAYKNEYSDHFGIQPEWLTLLRKRINDKNDKLPLYEAGVNFVINYIGCRWCQESADLMPVELNSIQEIQESIDGNNTQLIELLHEVAHPNPIVPSTPQVTVVQHPVPHEVEDIDDEVEQSDDDFVNLSIYINKAKVGHVVTFVNYLSWESKENSEDWADQIIIPINTNLDELGFKGTPSMADNRNGAYDLAIHFQPYAPFVTRDPEKYLKINEVIKTDGKRILILDEDDDVYAMGVYIIKVIIHPDVKYLNADRETLMWKLNSLVQDHIAMTPISQLPKTLGMMKDFLIPEDELFSEDGTSDNELSDDVITQAAMDSIDDDDTDEFEDPEDDDETEGFDFTPMTRKRERDREVTRERELDR